MASIEFTSGLASAGIVLEKWLEAISHNLANLDTPGYKRQVIAFKMEVLSETGQNPLPVGVNLSKRTVDLTQGMLKPTGNPLDLAISGEGFFVIETPSGTRYTRKGNFRLDPDGFLVTAEGYRVMGQGGPIMIGRYGSVVVNEAGEIIVDGEMVDVLRIVTFPEGTEYIPEGRGLIRVKGAQPSEARAFSVKQGYLERSNVSAIEEMVKLINVVRSFESYQKAVQTAFEDVSRRLLQEVIKA